MNRPAPTITTAKAPTFAAVVKRPANIASVDAKGGGGNGRGTETCYKRSMGRTRVARGSCSRATSVLAGFALYGAAACSVACGATPKSHGPDSATRTQATPTFASDAGEVFSFPELTASPLGVAQVPAALGPFLGQCKLGD